MLFLQCRAEIYHHPAFPCHFQDQKTTSASCICSCSTHKGSADSVAGKQALSDWSWTCWLSCGLSLSRAQTALRNLCSPLAGFGCLCRPVGLAQVWRRPREQEPVRKNGRAGRSRAIEPRARRCINNQDSSTWKPSSGPGKGGHARRPASLWEIQSICFQVGSITYDCHQGLHPVVWSPGSCNPSKLDCTNWSLAEQKWLTE